MPVDIIITKSLPVMALLISVPMVLGGVAPWEAPAAAPAAESDEVVIENSIADATFAQ
jgi:hypothetical protein